MNSKSPRRRRSARHAATAAATALLLAASAHAADAPSTPATLADSLGSGGPTFSWSAFGTLGAAVSDQSWNYQRFIDDHPSLKRDSVLGLQADVQFNPQWSATVQAKLAAAADSDSAYALTAAWAFAAWRPNNDWLVRAGKLRVPFLLRSEQLDVGATYDEARLPAEIYTLPPTNDFGGLQVTHTWPGAAGDLSLDGYAGRAALYKRFWIRDEVPSPIPGAAPSLASGALFTKANVDIAGLTLTWRAPDLLLRSSLLRARTTLADGQIGVRPVFVTLAPGVGYYQTSGAGADTTASVHNTLFTLGADAHLGHGWRVAGEFAHIHQDDTETGVDATAGYATVYKSIGAFTPYATLAAIRSSSKGADWQQLLDTYTVPGAVPGASLMNASMRAGADTIPVYRQRSIALGSSYAVTSTSKLKLEWLHTRASGSLLIDVPSGQALQQRRSVNVWSASYSFVF